MGYPQTVYRRSTQRPRTASLVRVAVVPQALGELGILPLVAAAVPSVSQILGKIGSSVLSILDPGKKRDANREARAEMFYQFASAGSITAARALYGGAEKGSVGAHSEIAMYVTRWQKLQAANPTLAAAARAAGPLGVGPDPGMNPPTIPADEQAAIQQEINAFHMAHAAAGITPPSQPGLTISSAGIFGGNMTTLLLGGALVYAVAAHLNKPTRGRR
jgi:hypothetical protein